MTNEQLSVDEQGLPEGWKEYKLADIQLECAMGPFGSNINTSNFKQYGVPVIRGQNLNCYRYIGGEFAYLSEKKADELKKSNCFPGDLVFTHRGTLGQVCLVPYQKYPRYVVSQSGMKLTVDPTLVCELFLFYFFKSSIGQYELLKNESQVGVPAISSPLKSLKDVNLVLPPLPEQKAIAEVLSSLDDKIDLLHQQNKTLEDLAQTLFRQWFVEQADKEWEKKRLSDIANFLNGLPCQKYPPKNESDKLPVLKIKQLRSGILDDSDWCTSDVKPEYIVNTGDVIFSWSASLMVKLWYGHRCVLNQHLFKVTSKQYPQWFYYYWSKHNLNKFIAISEAHATTMGHIKRTDLENALCFVPPSDRLKEMNMVMEPLLEKLKQNYKQLKTLEQTRDTLLPKLMNGELRCEYK